MTPAEPTARAEELLAQASWMRRLARRLVADEGRAEDLSQETWLRALAHPPAADRPLRGWLATVMRHALQDERRGDARRVAREHVAAEERAAAREPEDSARLLEQVAVQRALLEAVQALEEPYRTTVLLRYFDELSPRRIAARQGVPVATVKTRLARGLARLRERLDRDHGGDGRAWVLALLPLTRRPAGAAPFSPTDLPLGALVMNAKLLLAFVAVAAGAVGAALVLERDPQKPSAPALAAEPGAPAPAVLEDERPATGTAGAPAEAPAVEAREALSSAAAPKTAAPTPPAAGTRVRGRVVDVEGRPVGGVEVHASSSSAGNPREADGAGSAALAVTAADGSFETVLESWSSLVVRDERLTTVLGGTPVAADTGQETSIVVAPRVRLAGRVVDELGAPVPGARVALQPPPDLRARLGLVLDYSFEVAFSAACGDDGSFDLAQAPALNAGELVVSHDGFMDRVEPAPQASRSDLVLVLARPAHRSRMLSGVVVDPNGASVAEARVSLGLDSTLTDEQGAFAFDLDDPTSPNVKAREFLELDVSKLMALKPGFLPAELAAAGRDEAGRPVWPAEVVLRLGSEPLSIAGRVVDETGAPRAGAQVWIADPTFFGGLRVPGEDFPSFTHVENELAGARPGWRTVETDEDGYFWIDGLMERDYAVQAMDPTTLQRVEERAAAGSEDVELVLSSADLWPVLRGRVVDRRGRPLEDAEVFPMCDAFRTVIHGEVVSTHHSACEAVSTDEEGRFELERVPRSLVYLRIEHPQGIPLEWGRHVEGGLAQLVGQHHEALVIVLGRRCHFTVELSDPLEADALAMHDAEDRPVEISEFLGHSRREDERQPLINGRSNPLAVSDDAVTLVLYRAGEEVRRAPVQLDAETPTVLKP